MENIIDFPDKKLIEEEACRWILRFDKPQVPSEQDIAELKQWLEQSPTHREALLQYSELWSDMDVLAELMLPLNEFDKAPSSMLIRLMNKLVIGWSWMASRLFPQSTKGVDRAWSWPQALAALLLVAIVAAYPVVNYLNHSHEVYLTAIGEQASFELPDKSVVWLNTNSQVELDYSEDSRKLYLQKGEAYFKVAKDAARPFEVYANSKLVRAIGTAFSVHRLGDSIKVIVTEGKVDVAQLTPSNGLAPSVTSATGEQPEQAHKHLVASNAREEQVLTSLTAGQSILLADGDQAIKENIVHHERQELTRQLSWRDGLLVFAGEPLSEVVAEVSRYTAVKITLADPQLRSLRIGGQFRTGETEALFDILETGFGLKISRVGKNHVEIDSVNQDGIF